jgi:nucleoside-diphosphate-sugar epimerase
VNIAITGATGFIGNELVLKHLELGNSVRILTRRNKNSIIFQKDVKIFNGDLTGDRVLLDSFVKDVDVLYNCAAEIRDESKMHQVNVMGTQNLVNAAGGYVKHWVQLSSTGVYGNPSTGIITEVTPVDPKNTYETTKLRSDEIVIKAGNNNLFSYTILRPSNVFGSRMKNQSLYQLIRAIDNGLFFFMGKKGASANYISVENVVNALILCGQVQNAKGKIYILSDWMAIERFILLISDGLNKPFPKIRLPKFLLTSIASIGNLIPGFPITSSRVKALTNRHIYSSALIIKELNYSHYVSMEEGLLGLVLSYNRSINNSQ